MEISNLEILNSVKIICAFLLDACRLMDGHSHLIGGMSSKRLHKCFILSRFLQMWAVLSVLTSARFRDSSNTKIFGKGDKKMRDLNFLIAQHPRRFPVRFPFLHVWLFVWFKIPEISLSFVHEILLSFVDSFSLWPISDT